MGLTVVSLGSLSYEPAAQNRRDEKVSAQYSLKFLVASYNAVLFGHFTPSNSVIWKIYPVYLAVKLVLLLIVCMHRVFISL